MQQFHRLFFVCWLMTACAAENNSHACYNLSDEEGFGIIRRALDAKSERQKFSQAWRGVNFEELTIIHEFPGKENVAYTDDRKVLHLGSNNKVELIAYIYSDCEIGWSQ